MAPHKTDPILRFWSRVQKTNDCWIWTGSIFKTSGYARFCKYYGKDVIAHRMSWEIHNGPIPNGMYVCHTCDNRKCVNPAHLYLGTHQDNMNDRNRKNRQARGPAIAKGRFKRMGEDNGRAKLTKEQIESIRLLKNDASQTELAKMFNVSQQQISRILRNILWNS